MCCWRRLSVHVYKTGPGDGQTVGPAVLPDSCCALHPLCAFRPYTLIWLRLSIYISFIFSLISLRAQPRGPQKWEPATALEWKSVDERRPICDWMTEWLKEWRAKAVKLSVSLYRAHRREPTLRCSSGSQNHPAELKARELASSSKCTVLMISMAFMRCGWQTTESAADWATGTRRLLLSEQGSCTLQVLWRKMIFLIIVNNLLLFHF